MTRQREARPEANGTGSNLKLTGGDSDSDSTGSGSHPRLDPPPTVASARAEWLHLAVAAIARRAKHPGRFTAYDVHRDVPDPGHHNWWGIGMAIAHREGIIVPVAVAPSARPRTNRSLVRVWCGAAGAARSVRNQNGSAGEQLALPGVGGVG
jgi:hypothetical protein